MSGDECSRTNGCPYPTDCTYWRKCGPVKDDLARRCAEAEAENVRLRAELDARPDLTELREALTSFDRCMCALDEPCGCPWAIEAAARRLCDAADPAPAPDTVPSLTVGDSDQPWVQVPCPSGHPCATAHYAHLKPAPDTVTITVSREVAEGLAYLADYFNPEAAAPFRSALDAGQ